MSKLLPYLIIPDTHVPYHDERAWQLMLKVAKSQSLHGIVILGDFCDFYAVSSHSKNPSRAGKFEWEIKEVKKKLKELQNLDVKHKIYIEGNHEDRLTRYLQDRAPELHDIISIPTLLGLSKLGWEHVPYKSDADLGKICFTHDVGSAGRYSVYKCLDVYQHSNITGHTHRFAVIVEGNARGEYKLSAQLGWLGDVKQIDYMHKAKAMKDWAQGFGILYHDTKSGIGYLNPIPLVNYTVCVNGKLFRG
jgi:predicted phosphodiesterase